MTSISLFYFAERTIPEGSGKMKNDDIDYTDYFFVSK
jgi:hypothetical protein